MKRWKKIGRLMWQSLLVVSIALLIVELAYRYQWIDFYSREWKYQQEDMINKPKATNRVLVLGDSFSADANSWVNQWKRDTLETQTQVFNASIPGVGPETYRLLLKRRIKEVNPTHVIIQLYVGNDLYDMEKPVNWSHHSVSRNLFWSLSGHLRVLGYMNYRLGQASVETSNSINPREEEAFDLKLYSPRTQLYLDGDADYPGNAIRMEGSAAARLLEALDELKKMAGESVQFYVLIMPHCCQVSKTYTDRYRQLGSNVSDTLVGNQIWSNRIRKAGFTVIDPLMDLQQLEWTGKACYFANDPHLNPAGQKQVLEYTKKVLECSYED